MPEQEKAKEKESTEKIPIEIEPCEKKQSDSLPILFKSDLPKYYATRIFATHTEFDFRIVVMNEKRTYQKNECYIPETMVILTPTAVKELQFHLTELIEKWEKDYGKINSRPEKSIITKMMID